MIEKNLEIKTAVDTNMVKIVGRMVEPMKFSHEMYGEGFYNFEL